MKTAVTRLDLEDLSSDDPKIKYGRSKKLVEIARENPQRLLPHLEFFVSLLKSDNNILKWTAIDVIGGLAIFDKAKRIDRALPRLYEFLESGKLFTANHAISALTTVAQAKPEHRKRITRELLQTEYYEYETNECHNIVLGKVIQALGAFSASLKPDGSVVRFVSRQTDNSRPATRKKAEQFLKDIDKSAKKPTT